MSKAQEQIDVIMSQVQIYASAWSLIGGRFDDGGMLEASAEEKEYLRKLITDMLSASSEQQAAQQDAETLTVEEILHIQQNHVGGPCPSYPLDNSDWINFARAIEARVIAARASNGGKA